jgi:riboflavin kinase/FMN adenylyltransferase
MAAGAHLDALEPFPVAQVPARLAGGVVAIGNFDGVHRGHGALLDAARSEAQRRGAPAVVLTFEPHPRTVLRPEAPVFRLTPLPAKARVLKAIGLDGIAVATFDRTFAALTPDMFVERILVEQLKLSAAVVGFNFHFGRERQGTAAALTAAGRRLGFDVTVVEPVTGQSLAPVASSAIRRALAEGDVAAANASLGYRWFVIGTVEHGEARGRALGFPTANLRLSPDCQLRHGIYAVRFSRAGGVSYDGAASYGVRPTFGGGAPLLEVNVFGFDGDLYGEEVAVTFVDWIRPEAKFSGMTELAAAIRADVASARAILTAAGPGSLLDRRLAALP